MPEIRKKSEEEEPERELRRRNREELIEIIYTLQQDALSLEQENEKLSRQLEDRTIHLENAGSIAEAALSLNHIFEMAQNAADQYLASVKSNTGTDSETDKDDDTARDAEAEEIISSAKAEADHILNSAKAEADKIFKESKKIADEMIRQGEQKARESQDRFTDSLRALFQKYPNLAREWEKERRARKAGAVQEKAATVKKSTNQQNAPPRI